MLRLLVTLLMLLVSAIPVIVFHLKGMPIVIALSGSLNLTVKVKVDNNCVQTSRPNL